jgi:Flp pilus assembly protein TadB
MGTLAEYLCISMSVLGLLRLRKTRPLLPRPIKVSYFLTDHINKLSSLLKLKIKQQVSLFYPITFLFVCVFIIVVTLYQLPMESLICLCIMGSGVPVYFLGVKWRKPKSIQDKLGKILNLNNKSAWLIPEFLFLLN